MTGVSVNLGVLALLEVRPKMGGVIALGKSWLLEWMNLLPESDEKGISKLQTWEYLGLIYISLGL